MGHPGYQQGPKTDVPLCNGQFSWKIGLKEIN